MLIFSTINKENIMKRSLSIFIVFVVSVMLIGCIKVVSTNPADGSTGVAKDTNIKVTFDNEAKSSSVNTSTFIVKDSLNNPVEGTVSYAKKVATFTPKNKLILLRDYSVTITTGVMNIFNVHMKSDYIFGFKTADGDWGAAEIIESGGSYPQIALDESGNAILIWHKPGYLMATRYAKGSGWGTSELIGTGNTADSHQIAINNIGNAIVVSEQQNGIIDNIWANIYTPGTGWAAGQLIESMSSDASYPQVAIDTSGNAIAVWRQYDGIYNSIYANRYTPGSGWGTAQLIESNTGDANSPRIAMSPNGNAIAVWYQYDGARWSIYANQFYGSGWGAPQLIEMDNTGSAGSPQIAFDTSGNAIAVWQQWDGIRQSVYANRYIPGSGWGMAQLIETNNDGDVNNVQITFDSNGCAIVVWQLFYGTFANIWANRFTPGTGWGTAQLIDTYNDGMADYPQVAIDPAGNAIAVWEKDNGTRYNIIANRYISSIGWSTPSIINTDVGNARHPRIAVDPDGNAIAVWDQIGTQVNVWAKQLE
jgi:hypothetical protein